MMRLPKKPYCKKQDSSDMENFDERMRHKYDNDDPGGRFEFREEYWEQALALIEADEALRRQKRRRGLLWWSLAGLLLLSAGIGWWRMSGTHTGLNPEPAIGAHETTGRSTTQPGKSAQQDAAHATDETATTSNTATSNTNQTDKTNHSDAQNQVENNSSNTQNATQNAAGRSQQLSARNRAFDAKGNASGNNNSSTSDKQLTQKGKQANTTTQSSGLSTGAEQPTGNVTTAQGAGNGGAENALKNPENTSGADAENAASTTAPAAAQAKTLDKLLEQLFTLPLPMEPAISIEKKALKTPEKAEAPMASQIKPVKDSRFSAGIAASGLLYKSSIDKRNLGFTAALYGAYRINRHWSASVGVGARFTPGTWTDSSGTQFTESLLYSFGFESVKTERRAAGLLSLELPIAASWHHGAFGIEAGVAPGYLLYALDRYKQTTENSFHGPKTTRNRLEKADTESYGRYYANTFAGAEWWFSRNASLTLRGNYRLGALVKQTVEDPAVKAGASVELGLKLKLF